jgi:hypothetical protein
MKNLSKRVIDTYSEILFSTFFQSVIKASSIDDSSSELRPQFSIILAPLKLLSYILFGLFIRVGLCKLVVFPSHECQGRLGNEFCKSNGPVFIIIMYT